MDDKIFAAVEYCITSIASSTGKYFSLYFSFSVIVILEFLCHQQKLLENSLYVFKENHSLGRSFPLTKEM